MEPTAGQVKVSLIKILRGDAPASALFSEMARKAKAKYAVWRGEEEHGEGAHPGPPDRRIFTFIKGKSDGRMDMKSLVSSVEVGDGKRAR